MYSFTNLLVEIEEEQGIALLTINRADKLNALNHALLSELDNALDSLADDRRVKVLIITGAGSKAFVAGADIAELATLAGREEGVEFARFGQRIFAKIERLTKPVIMAINGYALGGGCELAMCGDIRLASETAQMGQPEVNLGTIPGYGGTQRLARIVGRDRAKGLIFTGERVSAHEAFRLGLVDRVLPNDELMQEAYSLARNLAAKAPRALALAKMAINEGIDLPLEEGIELEAELFGKAAGTNDMREGTSAFLEKRQPNWSGE